MSNGIPVRCFKGDKSDREFITLIPFLKQIAFTDDVRLANTRAISIPGMQQNNMNELIEIYKNPHIEDDEDDLLDLIFEYNQQTISRRTSSMSTNISGGDDANSKKVPIMKTKLISQSGENQKSCLNLREKYASKRSISDALPQ